ncbi:MAG: hypothetical protein JXR64_12815, partial [Spirochaetales bacterium]|nr:hypothetical protein [Spirochaetales bacterium]
IKGFENIISDPYETITFNFAKDKEVKALAKQIGADGKMLHRNNEIVLGSMNEKLLIHLLTKLGNFVPEGGIWMNTQRPEWNDANNALVGKGISVVTLAYIRRYINFLINIYKDSNSESFTIRKNLYLWLTQLNGVFSNYTIKIKDKITDKYRFEIVSQLGKASETYRNSYYNAENWEDINISRSEIIDFLNISLISVDDSLLKNRRTDDLYHSYNTLEISNKEIKIHYLYEMLEGQVAILTSGLLGPKDADKTLTALRNSAMFREDQNSYMLYPNRELLNFTKKNVIDANKVEANPVLMELIKKGNKDLVTVDVNGKYHFNGKFKNVKQVIGTLDKLGLGRNKEIEDLFEQTFNHQSFTGRSGTFFAYEGLGSIYWHMVSKLLLAAQENLFIAKDMGLDEKLINSLKNHYVDIRNGIGYKKSAEVYGAFPFDPYSHTPFGKGAKQPGMTGQVKEEVITRLGEMGIRVINGEIIFDTTLMDEDDFLTSPRIWSVKNAAGETLELNIPSGAFAGTHCQTPYIVAKGEKSCVNLYMNNGTTLVINQLKIPVEYSELIFSKSPDIKYIEIIIGK